LLSFLSCFPLSLPLHTIGSLSRPSSLHFPSSPASAPPFHVLVAFLSLHKPSMLNAQP